MFTVTIKDATVNRRKIRDFEVSAQTAILEEANGDRITVELSLPRGHAGYPPGSYTIGLASFFKNKYNALELVSGIALVPLRRAPAPGA